MEFNYSKVSEKGIVQEEGKDIDLIQICCNILDNC